jgi:hypothetical protein
MSLAEKHDIFVLLFAVLNSVMFLLQWALKFNRLFISDG